MRLDALVGCCALSALLCAAACNKDKATTASGAEVEETGQDLTRNPLGALGKLAQAGEAMAKKAEEMQKREPVEPVKFDALIAVLPQPEGWTAAEAKGQTTNMAEWKVSTASRRYTRGSGQDAVSLEVQLVDSGYVPMVYAPFTMLSQFSQESTEGHTKGIKVDGQPAVEKWTKKSQRTELTVLIDDRFLLTISGNGVTPELAREWAGLVGIGKISALGKA